MADDKYKSAGNIRSKITRFDFEGTASANIALSKKVGDVASVIEKKTDEQNRRFDKLLKVLEFLPKDAMEKRKQDKIVFTELARTVAALEKAAKDEPNLLKKIQILNEAKGLRKQGSTVAPDYDPSKAHSIKEWAAKKMFGLDPEEVRKRGLFGATKVGKVLSTDIGGMLLGKKDDAFQRQVEQEKLYPEAITNAKKVGFEARLKGAIRNTDEEGIKVGRQSSKGGSASRVGMEGIGSSVILRKIADIAAEIRDHIVGKGARQANDTEGSPPKGLFSAEELDKRNPANWKTFQKRDKNGRLTGKKGRIWNRKSKYTGKALKAGEEDKEPEVQEPEVLGLHTGIELTDEQKAKAAGTFDDQKHLEGQDGPQPKYTESGIEKEEPTKVEGSMTGSDGGSAVAIIAVLEAIVAGVEGFGLAMEGGIVAALGLAGAGLIIKDIYDLAKLWDLKKNTDAVIKEGIDHEATYLEQAAKRRGMTVPQMLEDNKKHGGVGSQQTEDLYTGKLQRDSYNVPYAPSVGTKGEAMERNFNEFFGIENKGTFIKTQKSKSGEVLDNSPSGTTPTVIAPVTNNTINNNGGGGKGSSGAPDTGMPSVRTPDPSIQRWQDKRQNRIF